MKIGRMLRAQRGSASQILLAVLSIALAVGLIAFVYWHKQQEAGRTAALKAELSGMEETEEPWQTTAKAERPSERTVPEEAESDDPSPVVEEETETGMVSDGMSFSVRGDGFCRYREDTTETSIANVLLQTLQAAGYQVTTEDATLDMAGSLTQMQHAGVDAAVIDQYLSEHRQLQGSVPLQDSDLILRDETPEELLRSDQEAVPIIGIGYSGGFRNDINELVRQQEQILATYSNPEQFLILGYYPESIETAEERSTYDEVMQSRWGEHYLDVNGALATGELRSAEVRRAIAEAIAAKLMGEH